MERSISILAVDDNEDALFALEQALIVAKFNVITARSGRESISLARQNNPDIILLDINMPELDGLQVLDFIRKDPVLKYIVVILLTATDDIIGGLQGGADDFIKKPYRTDELIARVHAAIRRRDLNLELKGTQQENRNLKKQLGEVFGVHNLIGKSSAIKEVFDLIEKVSDAPVPVLITGESGTGKELVAHALHYNSSRRSEAFVIQNCATFNEHLLDSELFGHVRGAFTGAIKDRDGLFQQADNGTLFLDEIGELPLGLQAKLLRVIQDGTFTPIGDTRVRSVDVRVLAATNKALGKMVSEGKFREDLFYRLNVVNILVPSLHKRSTDIPLLADHFLREFSKKIGREKKVLADDTLALMVQYTWPGNVRELQNEIERLVLLSGSGKEISSNCLSPQIRESKRAGSIQGIKTNSLKESLTLLEHSLIQDALTKSEGNKTEAAKLLGISRSNLISKAQRFGIG